MPNLKYEAKFIEENTTALTKKLKFTSLINGSTSFNKNEVIIKIISNKQNKPLIENVFYYKE